MSLSLIQQGGSSVHDSSKRNTSSISSSFNKPKTHKSIVKDLNIQLVQAFESLEDQHNLIQNMRSQTEPKEHSYHQKAAPTSARLSSAHSSFRIKTTAQSRGSVSSKPQTAASKSYRPWTSDRQKPQKSGRISTLPSENHAKKKQEYLELTSKFRNMRKKNSLSSVVNENGELEEYYDGTYNSLKTYNAMDVLETQDNEEDKEDLIKEAQYMNKTVSKNLKNAFHIHQSKPVSYVLGPARSFTTIKTKMHMQEEKEQQKSATERKSRPTTASISKVKDSPQKVSQLKQLSNPTQNTQRSTAPYTERSHHRMMSTISNTLSNYEASRPTSNRFETEGSKYDNGLNQVFSARAQITEAIATELDAFESPDKKKQNEQYVSDAISKLSKTKLNTVQYKFKPQNYNPAASSFEPFQPRKTAFNIMFGKKYKKPVNQNDRKKFGVFLENDFIKTLISTKNQRKVNEVKYITLEDIKRTITENRNIKMDFPETHEELEKARELYAARISNYEASRNLKKIVQDDETKEDLPEQLPFNLFTPDTSQVIDSNVKPLLNKKRGMLKHRKQTHKKDYAIDRQILISLESAGEYALKQQNALDDIVARKKAEDIEQDKYKRLRRALRTQLVKWSKLKLSLEEITQQQIFPSEPYERSGSYNFIKAAKFGNLHKIFDMLREDKYLVYAFDPIRQTALHWAAKRGYLDICRRLIEYGADFDAVDMGFRTPLYYALRGKHVEVVRLLCYCKADPWSSHGNYDYGQVTDDLLCKRTISKARQLNIIMSFYACKDRDTVWTKRAKEIFEGDTFLKKDRNLLAMEEADDDVADLGNIHNK